MQATLSRTLLAALALAIGFSAQGADKQADARKVTGNDRHFITQATEDGHAEVALGKLAQQNGANKVVKDFGQRMVADHGKANEELAGIATKLGITPPSAPGAKHKADMKKLSKLKAADFDREYAEHMVKDHEKAVTLFEKEARNGEAPELKAFASKTLPVLQEHLKRAKAMQSQIEHK